MTTYYIDLENGNDANSGTSFADRWKTLTSATGGTSVSAGDVVRVMGTPEPTLLGNATWTSGVAGQTLNVVSGTVTTPISLQVNVAHNLVTGDTVNVWRVNGMVEANGTWNVTVIDATTFTLDGSIGVNTFSGVGSCRKASHNVVHLASAVTQNIASTGPNRNAWTSGNAAVTAEYFWDLYNHKESYTDKFTINAGYTGLVAYYATGNLDLSNYQQVNFWQRIGSSPIQDGDYEIRLCSDLAGQTAVHTISLPSYYSSNRWQTVVEDLGTNLSNNVNSVALYRNTSFTATHVIQLSNIFASKGSSEPDSLTLNSSIGKNTAGETFWAIQNIDVTGTRIGLDAANTYPWNAQLRGYNGTSETVPTYKRQPFVLQPISTSSISSALQVRNSGQLGNPVTISGGWDRTDMSTQDSETWISSPHAYGSGVDYNRKNYIHVENFGFSRLGYGLYETNNTSGKGHSFDIIAANNCITGIQLDCPNISGRVRYLAACSTGLRAYATAPDKHFVIDKVVGCDVGARIHPWKDDTLKINAYNCNYGTFFAGIFGNYSSHFGSTVIDSTFSQNNYDLSYQYGGGEVYAINSNFLSSNSVSVYSYTSYNNLAVCSQNHDGVADNHKIFMREALISSATDQRHTPSGISWKIQPTSSNRKSDWPVPLSLAKIACTANVPRTVKVWMRRDSTGLSMRLLCKGARIAGIPNDVTSDMTAAADTWEEVSISFTPSETGVVEVLVHAWSDTSIYTGWVDDLSIE